MNAGGGWKHAWILGLVVGGCVVEHPGAQDLALGDLDDFAHDDRTSSDGGSIDGNDLGGDLASALPCPASWTPRFTPSSASYTFTPRCFGSASGVVHYIDEGAPSAAETVLFVHGSPTWTFLYRELVAREVAAGHRVVSADFLGYGLSDKPALAGFQASVPFDYTPRAQAAVLEALVLALDLHGVTLVVHDWGGPIGLGVATRHPDRIGRIMMLNTWAWSVDLAAPGADHTLVDFTVAQHTQGAQHTKDCFIVNASAQKIANARSDSPAVRAALLADYKAPWEDPTTGLPLSDTVCLPTVKLSQSIADTGDFQDEVRDALGGLQGKPISYVWGAADLILGEAHCDLDLAPADRCAAYPGTTCTCDPGLGACPAVAPATPSRAWVCRAASNTRVVPYVDRLRSLIGDAGLVEVKVLPTTDHFATETDSAAIGVALDALLATPR